jgi:uncharacterized protein (DUF58 family)
LWVSARFVFGTVAVAVLLAASPGVHVLAAVAVAAGAVLLLLAAVDLARLPPPDTIDIAREVPAHFSLRRTAELVYTIRNASQVPLRIGIVETPLRTIDLPVEDLVVAAPPRSIAVLRTPVLPKARGADRFSRIYIWYESALGLVRRRVSRALEADIRVYPDLSAVERYGSLQTRNRLIEAGLRRMRVRGVGSEFESVRDYAAGDAFRSIDWKATARRGKLMVTQREVERSQDVVLLIDCGRLMTARVGDQRKLDYAITAALSVASIAALASDRVGVVAFAKKILFARAPRSTAASVHALAQSLSDIEPRFEEADYAHAFSYVRSHLLRRSLVVFFTDVIDPVSQSAILAELGSLAKRNVVLCAFMNDEAVAKELRAEPVTIDDAYRLDVAAGLAAERGVARATLNRHGIIVLDVPAPQLSVAAIDEYLRVKARGVL